MLCIKEDSSLQVNLRSRYEISAVLTDIAYENIIVYAIRQPIYANEDTVDQLVHYTRFLITALSAQQKVKVLKKISEMININVFFHL